MEQKRYIEGCILYLWSSVWIVTASGVVLLECYLWQSFYEGGQGPDPSFVHSVSRVDITLAFLQPVKLKIRRTVCISRNTVGFLLPSINPSLLLESQLNLTHFLAIPTLVSASVYLLLTNLTIHYLYLTTKLIKDLQPLNGRRCFPIQKKIFCLHSKISLN